MTPPTEKPTAEEVAQTKPDKPAGDEPRFTVERLIAESYAAVGQPPQVVAGAFAGVSDQTEVTVSEAKDRCRKWLRAPVEVDPALKED